MIKIRFSSLNISMNWMMIGAALVYGAALGFAISTGKTKTVSFFLIPTILFIFRTFSERIKFGLLALSIPLALVQIPSLPLPYGTTASEAILLVLAFDDILFLHDDQQPSKKPVAPILFLFLGLFCIGGLIPSLRRNSFTDWNLYCFLPLIIFFLIFRKIHNREDAWLFVKLSLLTIVGFIVIIEWAIMTGHYIRYDPLHTEGMGRSYRLADGMIVVLGPIKYIVFATRIGAIAALGLPTSVLLWIQSKGKVWWRTALLLIIFGFVYVLISSATRGSVLAAVFGSLMVILISGRFRSPKFVGALVLSSIIIILLGEAILNLFPEYNIQRILTLLQGVESIPNYHQRLDVLALAWKLTLQNPLGVGFSYLSQNKIDDAIIYSYILSGTGILGSIAFIMIVGSLAFQLGLGVLKSHTESARDIASVGVSTLATGLIAGVSSQSILFEPVHSFVFWMLMAVCYFATVRLPS